MSAEPSLFTPEQQADWQKRVHEATLDLIKKHAIATEELTEIQIANALKQAIACGDFTRHVIASTNFQHVVYKPYRREMELLSEIARLKDGDFTEGEIQDFCHNLPTTVSPREFCDGCESYQQKLFGSSEITEMKRALLEIRKLVESFGVLVPEHNTPTTEHLVAELCRRILTVTTKATIAAVPPLPE